MDAQACLLEFMSVGFLGLLIVRIPPILWFVENNYDLNSSFMCIDKCLSEFARLKYVQMNMQTRLSSIYPVEEVHETVFWRNQWRNAGCIIKRYIVAEITCPQTSPSLMPINGLVGIGHDATTVTTIQNQVVNTTNRFRE